MTAQILSLSDLGSLRHADIKLRDRLLHDRDAVIHVRQLFLVILESILVANIAMSQHLRLTLGLVEALTEIGLLATVINLLSIERAHDLLNL